MKRILAVILALSMLTMCVGASLAEEEGPTIKITDAEGKEIYSGPYSQSVLSQYTDGAQYEITGNVGDDIHFQIDNAKLIVNGELKGGLWANGEKNTVDVKGNINTTDSNGIYTANSWKQDEQTEEWVEVPNSSTITVDGDVTAISTDHDNWSYGTIAGGNSDITVGGDVSADYVGISASDQSTVTVGGDVEAGFVQIIKDGDYERTYNEGYGISASDEATVTVGGNVVSNGSTAVSTTNGGHWDEEKKEYVEDTTKATITIDGGVTSNHSDGISACGESTITVGKNEDGIGVKAYDDGIVVSDKATVTVNGDVKAGHEEKGKGPGGSEYISYSGDGITTDGESEATVTVNGNVESAGKGISAENDSHYDSETKKWIEETNKSTITVNGNVTSTGRNGIYAEGESIVTVTGSVTSNKSDGINAYDKSTVTAGSITAYTNGVTASDKAIVTVNGDIKAGHKDNYTYDDGTTSPDYYSGNAIYTYGDATITVTGSAESEGTAIVVNNNSDWDYETEKYVVEPSKATVTVDGDVTSNHSNGIAAHGEATVTVGGDLEAYGQGISLTNDYTWEKDEETEEYKKVYEDNQATVIVSGDVTATKAEAIDMEAPNTTIKVWGDVTGGDFVPEESDKGSSSGEDEPIDPREEAYWEAYDEAYDAKRDELFGEYADRFDDDYYEGAIAISSAEEANGQLIVGGTVTAQGESVPVVINLALDPDKKGEIPELEKALPDMKIYEIAPNDGEYFQVNAFLYKEDVEFSFEFEGEEITRSEDMWTACLGGEERAEVVETLAKTIQYIIKVIDPANGQINLDGVTYDEENDLMLAHEGDNITVRVGAGNGYRVTGVDAGNIAELTRNPDGTWTVTVKRGGGVTISATIERVSSKRHPALNQTILFGHYDVNGDGTAEELAWLCTKVSGSYAKLALIEGFEEKVPEDFATAAFNEDEMGSIKDGAVTEMAAKEAKYRFKDEKIHPVINVKLSSIGY